MLKRRPEWDTWFMQKALLTAQRATCLRKSVGAVLTRHRREISCGYNGARANAAHCTEVGCLLVNDRCVRCIHAEENAILTAARHGISTEGATCYTTTLPCWRCFQMLLQAGIQQIYWLHPYTGFNADVVKAHAFCTRLTLEGTSDDLSS